MDSFARELAIMNLGAYCSMSCDQTHRVQGKAYLNRITGEMKFVFRTDKEAARWLGVTALQHAADRAAVEASPSEWVEVPKYDSTTDLEEFIRRFLTDKRL